MEHKLSRSASASWHAETHIDIVHQVMSHTKACSVLCSKSAFVLNKGDSLPDGTTHYLMG